MEPIKLSELLAAIDGEAFGFDEEDALIHSVSIDTRTLQPGETYWALKGHNHDGHRFLKDARRNGAAACVVDSQFTGKRKGPRIEVADTQTALLDFAHFYRRRFESMIVGVTGSVGKTTTRRMVHAVLSTGFNGMQSPKNFNNHFGVPLSVLQLDSQHEFAVLELGASGIGEIRELADVAAPEVGIVTAIAPAHLSGFGSIDDVEQAKGELIESLPPSGFAVLNGDDQRCRSISERASCPTIFVGEDECNDLVATDVTPGLNSISFTADGERYTVPAVGRHHLVSALAAIVVGREIGLDSASIHQGLSNFQPANGRCQIKRDSLVTIIDDTYNSSPRSVQAACRLLTEYPTDTQKFLVLGDMLELGRDSETLHFDIGSCIGESGIDGVIAIGQFADDFMSGATMAGMTAGRLATCQDSSIVHTMLDCWLQPGDVVLVKGSRSTHMESVVQWIENHFASDNTMATRPVLGKAA